MRVSKIKISGFRSFVEEIIIDDLNRVNIFVGKNAVGKTNILEIFLFLRGLTQNNFYRQSKDFISINKKSLSLSLEFVLEEDEREKYIKDIFQKPKIQLNDIIQSNFLRKITHQLTATLENGVKNEMVSIGNVIDGDLIVWQQVREEKDNNLVVKGSDLALYKQIERVENLKLPLVDRVTSHGPHWQILWETRYTDVFPIMLKEFYNNIDWVPPIRQAQTQMPVTEMRRLDTSGSNLTQVWNTIVSEDPQDVVNIGNEMRKITPCISSINAPVRGKQAVAFIKESTGNKFDLSNTSSGLHQAAILITKIMTCPKGIILLIEEPELHLHASAQRALRQHIEEYSTVIQFFITTHSTIFANIGSDCSVYLVTKRGVQSNIKRVKESDEMRFIKWELGHSNTDLYGFNLLVFIEGDSEDIALPIIAESLGYDLVQEGIKLINVKGSGKAKKIEQYLEYLKDTDTLPFIILDGNKEVKKKLEDWERSNLIPNGNYQMWDKEFEDLFSLDSIVECCTKLGYKGITVEKLEQVKGGSSVVHAIKKILYESNERELDKPALAETLAIKISKEKQEPFTKLKNVIERLYKLSKS
jgi:predicted ATP-dependent endonuclease of OLD family